MLKQLLAMTDKYESIILFRHSYPDGDALGSQFGLKNYLESVYPDKKIYAVGQRYHSLSHFPPSDILSDDVFEKSLAIVLDCANRERIDDQRYLLCRELIKIDHHPRVDDYGDLQIVNVKASATCEILAEMMMNANAVLTDQCADYLYCGLIADTQKFSIPAVTSQTFKAAAYLTQFDVNVQECAIAMFSASYDEYRFISYLRTKVHYDEGVAYAVLNKEDYESQGMDFESVKSKVFVMNDVNEFKVYALFTQNPETLEYNGSLRSKTIIVNDIAAKYHGGGHQFASGTKHVSLGDIQMLINELKQRLKESGL